MDASLAEVATAVLGGSGRFWPRVLRLDVFTVSVSCMLRSLKLLPQVSEVQTVGCCFVNAFWFCVCVPGFVLVLGGSRLFWLFLHYCFSA